jgi:hypothetical protein
LESRLEYGKYDWLQRNKKLLWTDKILEIQTARVYIPVKMWQKTAALGLFPNARPDRKTRSTR